MSSDNVATEHDGKRFTAIAVVGIAIRTSRFNDLKQFRTAWFAPLDPVAPAPPIDCVDLPREIEAAVLADARWSGPHVLIDLNSERFIEEMASALRDPGIDFAAGVLCGCREAEAGGIIALKTLTAAERDGDRIYCLLAPGETGDFSSAAVVEICDPAAGESAGALKSLFPRRRDAPICRLGEPSAGDSLRCFRALVTIVLATHLKTIPPGRLAASANPEQKAPFYGADIPRPWIHGRPEPREAVVFGCVCEPRMAVLAREYSGPCSHPVAKLQDYRPSELYLRSAESRDELAAVLRLDLERIDRTQAASLARFCLERSIERLDGKYRIAIVASSAADLAHKIGLGIASLGARERSISERHGYYHNRIPATEAKTVFLYPGFNSEYPGMLSDLCQFFPRTREWFDCLDRHSDATKALLPSDLIYPPPEGLSGEEREKLLWDLKLGGPAGLVANLAMGELLEGLGVRCDAVAGHSNGENAALIAADVFRYREKDAILDMVARITRHYREGDHRHRRYSGHFLLVSGLAEAELRGFVESHGDKVRLAMENCVNQVVLYASAAGEELAAKIRSLGGICMVRPTERPYHTSLFEEHAGLLEEFYREASIGSGLLTAYSTATTEPFPSDAASIREVALRQWITPVRFRQTLERLYNDGFRCFIESGPDATVTAFVKDTLRGRDHIAVASNVPYRSGWEQLQHLAARLFVEGIQVRPALFFEERGLEAEPRRAAVVEAVPEQPAVASGDAGAASTFCDSAREQAIASHFQLMDRFLESQHSVMTAMIAALAGGRSEVAPAAASVALAPAPPPNALAPGKTHSREWRLTGEIIEQSEGHFYSERVFDARHDRFLLDHALGRRISVCDPELIPLPIVPFTVSMTILAEAACRLSGGKRCLALIDIRGSRWLAADRGSFRLGIEARRQNQTEKPGGFPDAEEIRVRLYEIDRESSRRYLAFEGTALVGDEYPERPAPMAFPREGLKDAQVPTEFFYSYCTYNGPVFQGIRQVLEFDERAIVADLQAPPTTRFRADGADPGFAIPGALLDSTGQLAGYWLVEQGVRDFGIFPFRAARYSQFGDPPRPGARCRTQCNIRQNGHIVTCSFDFLGDGGRVFARVEDMELRFYDNPWVRRFFVAHDPDDMFTVAGEAVAPDGNAAAICRKIDTLPGEFLHQSWNIWSRALAHLILNSRELGNWYRLPDRGAPATRILLERLVAKDAVRVWARREAGMELLPADIDIEPLADERVQARCSHLPQSRPIPPISVHSEGESAVARLDAFAAEAEMEYSAAVGSLAFDNHRQPARA